MEDQERDMDIVRENVRPIKAKTDKKKKLTIIIMGSIGKIRTFKISQKGLLTLLILLLLYIPTSVIIANNYFNLRRLYSKQSKLLTQQVKELELNQKNLMQSQEHEALLEDYIRNLTIPKGAVPKTVPKGTIPKGTVSPKNVTPPKQNQRSQPSVVSEKREQEEELDIQDVKVVKEGSQITIDLKLVNNDPNGKRLGGFVHMLAIAGNVNPPQVWVYPRQELENGLPMDFRRGELFIMKSFRSIQGKIYLVPDGEAPSNVKVLVYDQSGEIMIEKVFEVPDES